jgi:hypothetical protein
MEIVISEDAERDVQRQSLRTAAEEVDDRDWRARAPASEGDAAGWAEQRRPQDDAPQQQQGGRQQDGQAPQQQAAAASGQQQGQQQQQKQQQGQGQQQQGGAQQWQGKGELPKIQKAEDLGRQKYVVGAAVGGNERVSFAVRVCGGDRYGAADEQPDPDASLHAAAAVSSSCITKHPPPSPLHPSTNPRPSAPSRAS